MRRPWERSFHAVFFGGAAGKTQRGGRYLPWLGGRGCVGAFFRTRRAGGETAFLRTRWAGGGTAFLRHSLRWKHGRWAYLCFRALSPASCGKGEPVRRALFLRVARGRGAAVRSRQERRRFFGSMKTDALTGAFFLGVTREGESVRRASSGDGRRCLCAPRGDGAMAWRGGFLHTLRGVKMPGL